MVHEHSPSGSKNIDLTDVGRAEIPGDSRRRWLAGAGAVAVGGLLTLSACVAGRKTERNRSSDSEEDGHDSDPSGNAPEEENNGEKKYDTYNKLNLDCVYTDVARYDFEGNAVTGSYVKSGWSRRNGRLERVSEPETLPPFTALELADEYTAGKVNDGEIRHWLGSVAAEEHPEVPGLGGRFDDNNYEQNVSLDGQVPPPSERRKKAENIWKALGVLGQYAQGLALDIEKADEMRDDVTIDKDAYNKVLWLVCCAATSSEKAANKLRTFVVERARNVKSPEQAEECMEWWTTAKLTGAKPVLGSYNSENENAPNRRAGRMSVQIFVGDDPKVNVIGQASDGPMLASIGGTERVVDYSDSDY